VTQDDERSFALLGNVHPDAVRLHESVLDLFHVSSPPPSGPVGFPFADFVHDFKSAAT
jgi:hypothetical protein